MREVALRVLEEERQRLWETVPDGELSLTGGASLPGALTFGDVDLHLRVPLGEFDAASDALRAVYSVVHPDIWERGFATFEVPGVEPPTGIALTAIDGEHDRLFRRSWQLLAADPQLLDAYNEMKRRHFGADPEAYRSAKSAFFAWLIEGSGAELPAQQARPSRRAGSRRLPDQDGHMPRRPGSMAC